MDAVLPRRAKTELEADRSDERGVWTQAAVAAEGGCARVKEAGEVLAAEAIARDLGGGAAGLAHFAGGATEVR